MAYGQSYYVMQDSRGAFVRFKNDASFTTGLDFAGTLWERAKSSYQTNRDFFQNDPYRALSSVADSDFDCHVYYTDGEDTCTVMIPRAQESTGPDHFELNGLRAIADA